MGRVGPGRAAEQVQRGGRPETKSPDRGAAGPGRGGAGSPQGRGGGQGQGRWDRGRAGAGGAGDDEGAEARTRRRRRQSRSLTEGGMETDVLTRQRRRHAGGRVHEATRDQDFDSRQPQGAAGRRLGGDHEEPAGASSALHAQAGLELCSLRKGTEQLVPLPRVPNVEVILDEWLIYLQNEEEEKKRLRPLSRSLPYTHRS